LVSNPGRRDKKLATNFQSYDTATIARLTVRVAVYKAHSRPMYSPRFILIKTKGGTWWR
jgi:hypothetical protein